MKQVVCIGLAVLDHVFQLPKIPKFPVKVLPVTTSKQAEEMQQPQQLLSNAQVDRRYSGVDSVMTIMVT